MKITRIQDETIIEVTWWDRVRLWVRHKLLRCDGWCAYCMTEADEVEREW